MLLKEKEAYKIWLCILRDFPKVERFGLGHRIDAYFLQLLERTSRASYLSIRPKIIALAETIAISDTLKFLMQSAWELELISLKNYAEIFPKLEHIGQMLWGWKKGMEKKIKLENKLPTK
ncbi:MAG TPA: four helix bundle protein [Candidatus Paceibacterota bacterium]